MHTCDLRVWEQPVSSACHELVLLQLLLKESDLGDV